MPGIFISIQASYTQIYGQLQKDEVLEAAQSLQEIIKVREGFGRSWHGRYDFECGT
ncbi:MAG: hypothetical protein ABR999_09910 [Methanoregula sp.]|jgi:hypothetical protein